MVHAVVYLYFSKGFDMLCHSLLPEKLLCYSPAKWSMQWGGELADRQHAEGGGASLLSCWQPVTSGVPRDQLWAQYCLISS